MHGAFDDVGEPPADGIELDRIAQRPRERVDDLLGVVARPVETPIDQVLDGGS